MAHNVVFLEVSVNSLFDCSVKLTGAKKHQPINNFDNGSIVIFLLGLRVNWEFIAYQISNVVFLQYSVSKHQAVER